MRIPSLRAFFDLFPGELVVDLFAGGGGASDGIAAAIGRPVDIAINHDPIAIAMHAANHPETRHYIEDVWKVDPREACAGRPVGFAWFSPDCTHHSKAKGGRPVSSKRRSLAWAVIRWAKTVRPRVIAVENVEEFEDWGPLDSNDRPDKTQKGNTFRHWLAKLVDLGYNVEYRRLVAADYGTPTTRRRFFLLARCDGQPIVWPEATHGKGRLPWRSAAEIIDWAIPCRSIFERTRPLADATMRRIATGVRRYVVESARPFIVPVKSWGGGGNDPRSIDLPMRTVTASKRGEFALVAPTLIQTGYGERVGQAPRVLDLQRPLGTVVACGQKHALVATFLAKHYGGPAGHQTPGSAMHDPTGTVTTQDHHALVSALVLPTMAASGNHLAEVRAFLVKYYGGDGRPAGQQQSLFAPLHTVTTRARFGLVTIHGQDYAIADIGMRMLAPHELFAAQGFRGDYIIDPQHNGRALTKTQQIGLAGNSVPPQLSEALTFSNAMAYRGAA